MAMQDILIQEIRDESDACESSMKGKQTLKDDAIKFLYSELVLVRQQV